MRATYALLKSGRTTAVFQLESRGMKDLIRRLQPDCFEDIVALDRAVSARSAAVGHGG